MRSAAPTAATGPRPAPVAAAALRVCFGLVWTVDAGLKWLPGFRQGFSGMLAGAATGQPGWLQPWFGIWRAVSRSGGGALAWATALTETAIALGLLVGLARGLTYLVGAGYGLLLWASAEGFGGPYRSGSTDVGAGIVYALAFIALAIMATQFAPDRWSADYRLERRIPWWWRLSRLCRPMQLRPVDLSRPVRAEDGPPDGGLGGSRTVWPTLSDDAAGAGRRIGR